MARKRKKNSNPALLFLLLGVGIVFGAATLGATIYVLQQAGLGFAQPGYHGESVLAAEAAPLGTPLRSHPSHPWVRLLSAKQEISPGSFQPLNRWMPGKVVVIEYESSADFSTHPAMNHAEMHVVLKNERGEEAEFGNIFDRDIFEARGELLMGEKGFFPRRSFDFTPNMEVFVVLDDTTNGIYDIKRFKISNSLCIGTQSGITLAREWKPEEVAVLEKMATSPEPKLNTVHFSNGKALRDAAKNSAKSDQSMPKHQPPPAPPPADVPRPVAAVVGAGVKSAAIGGSGGHPFESAKSGQAVLGFNYRFGEWANQPSISAIAAVYGAEPIPPGHQQVLAKDDYAVGGLQIELKQYVTGFRVVFMKRGVNGRLDPNDQYLSDWIRAGRIPGKPQAPLVSDGRLVIGIHGRAAAVVDALGLVFE